MTSILFILAVVPVVVICTYIYRKDKNKEPGSLLVKLFLLGIASCFLVLLISEIVSIIFSFMNKDISYMNFFEVLAYAFIGVALIEEFSKWLMVYKGAYHNRAYDELYDGIVYSVYVSLGFAFFENLLYVLGNQSIIIGIARGISAVPGHACDAVFMGYYLSIAKVYANKGMKDLERKNLIKSILVPTILHGIYDFCLFASNSLLLLVFFVFVIVLYIVSIRKIKELAGTSKANNPQPANYQYQQYPQKEQYSNQMSQINTTPQPKFCPNCGSSVNTNFCPNCGARQN